MSTGTPAPAQDSVHQDSVDDDANVVLGAPEINRALTRIAHEILERNRGGADVVLLGIPTRGLPLARRLAERLLAVEPGLDPALLVGSLDVTMYRDDLAHQPRTASTTTPTSSSAPRRSTGP